MTQVVANVVRVRCGGGAGSRTGFCRIDKPTWDLGAGSAGIIKKLREHVKGCVIEGYDWEQPAPPAPSLNLLQGVMCIPMANNPLVRHGALQSQPAPQPAPHRVAFWHKGVTSVSHVSTEYLWERKGHIYHLQQKRYVSLCGRFWLRGENKHLMGAFIWLKYTPDNLCPACEKKGVNA